MRSLLAFALLVVCVNLWTPTAHAAQVYLDAEGTYDRMDTFYVPVRIDPQGACINAARVAIAYDPQELSVKDISTGRSIFTLWTEPPTVVKDSNGHEVGRVTFEGGVPGGYCGRIEGDPGLTNIMLDLVVTGVPQALPAGDVRPVMLVVEPVTRIFLHDGAGTEVTPALLGAEFSLMQSTSTPSDVWLSDVLADTIAPEDFDVTLVPGPSVGNDKSYIAFSTVDKQSGIDHYEVLETDPDRFGLLSWVPKTAQWVHAESPYVLRDQHLRSKILVKAVDKKGNERIAEYTPPISPLVELTRPVVLIELLLLAVLVGVIVLMVLRTRRKRQKHQPPMVDEGEQEQEGYA